MSEHPQRERKKHVQPEHSLPVVTRVMRLAPGERDDYGVTMTVRETTTGQLLTVVGHGPTLKAGAECCDKIDWLNGDFRVVSVSTPGTIFRDLQGHRNVEGDAWPEAYLLTRVGRADLITERRFA